MSSLMSCLQLHMCLVMSYAQAGAQGHVASATQADNLFQSSVLTEDHPGLIRSS